MKSRFFKISLMFVCFICSSLFLSLSTNKLSNIKTNAESTSFEISNDVGGYATITSGGGSISNTASNFDELLVVLKSNLTNPDDTIEIVFSDFILPENEVITLTSGDYILKGTLLSSSTNHIINLNSYDTLSVKFLDLTITANNSSKIVNVANSSLQTEIIIENTSFVSTTNKSYGLFFESSNHLLTLAGNNTHSTTYFYNHKVGLSTEAPTELTNTNTLKVEIDYDCNNQIILSNSPESNFEKIECTSLKQYLTVSEVIRNSKLVSLVDININFDLNGATPNTTLNTKTIYENTYSFNFLTETELSKSYSTFEGWFGKIVLTDSEKLSLGADANILYFDSVVLEEFVNSNYDYSKLKTDINSFEKENSFSNYLYDATSTNINSYWNLFVFLKQNHTPEFVAKWTFNTYTITFNTGNGSTVEPISAKYGDTISAPNNPTLTGYNFTGWYTDANATNPYTFSTMQTNKTLYAGWQIKVISITFVLNNGEENQTITQNYGTPFEYPKISKIGATLNGWFTDEEFTSKFSLTTMPDTNTILYAKWTDIVYLIHLISDGGSILSPITAKYGATISAPTQPTKVGHTFLGWYTDDVTYSTPFVFDTMPLGGDTVYAKWRKNTYTLIFISNTSTNISSLTIDYGTTLTLPTPLNNYNFIKPNYTFAGWFEEDLTTEFTNETMPAKNTTIYAKWIKKQSVSISLDHQSYTINDFVNYKPNSNLSGFSVQYLVDNNWTSVAPTQLGLYDIKILRNEDSEYASFEAIISGGLEITQEIKNFTWIIVLLFSLGVIEIVGIVFVKILHKKKSSPLSVVPFVSTLLPISTTQLILLIISGVFALVCFIVLVYEIVKLSKATPNFEQEVVDVNRMRFQTFQEKEAKDAENYKRFSKYSADDVKSILETDTFESDLKKRNEKYNPDERQPDLYIPHYETQDDLYEEVEYNNPNDEDFEDIDKV